jgi:exodeoxyribonuclease VII large subunit
MASADAEFDDEFDDELDDDVFDDSESESNDYTVSEFVDEINFALDDAFSGGVWVTGEIEGFKTPKPHYYFDLIEKGDNGNSVKLPASMWGGVANKLMPKLRNAGVEFKNGIKVRVHGRVDYYGPFGKLSLKVDDIDPNFTIGEVQAERDALLRKLKEEGAFAVNKEH